MDAEADVLMVDTFAGSSKVFRRLPDGGWLYLESFDTMDEATEWARGRGELQAMREKQPADPDTE